MVVYFPAMSTANFAIFYDCSLIFPSRTLEALKTNIETALIGAGVSALRALTC